MVGYILVLVNRDVSHDNDEGKKGQKQKHFDYKMPKRRPLCVWGTTRTYPNTLYKDFNNSFSIKVHGFGQVSRIDEKHMTSNIMYSAAVKT